MLNRLAALAAVCVVTSVAPAPIAWADPPADPAAQSAAATTAPPAGGVASGPAGVLDTPDGWHLNVFGKNETQLPVAPLTTALSSREYLVGGTFGGVISGSGKTKLTGGTLEAGYQIGCGINADDIENIPGAGITPGLKIPFSGNSNGPAFGLALSYQGKVDLKAGTVNIVPVDTKSFKGNTARVTITGLRVKFDQCVGQSFIRSYATLTASTADTDDVITYLGVTKAV